MPDFAYWQYFSNLNEFEKKHAPSELYWEGDFSLLTKGKRVSVVGSRKATDNGITRAQILTREFVKNGITIVSGLAEGIDTIAHITAIKEGGKTIAVLGTSLDKCFPARNKFLLEEIKSNHLAISQFAPGRGFDKSNFPRRNRTMALISDATVIVEAGEKSGTRHQGWEALRLARQVFILESIITASNLSWAKELVDYGAIVLDRHSLEDAVLNIPSTTSYYSIEEQLF